jgi:hypothetical protein
LIEKEMCYLSAMSATTWRLFFYNYLDTHPRGVEILENLKENQRKSR